MTRKVTCNEFDSGKNIRLALWVPAKSAGTDHRKSRILSGLRISLPSFSGKEYFLGSDSVVTGFVESDNGWRRTEREMQIKWVGSQFQGKMCGCLKVTFLF